MCLVIWFYGLVVMTSLCHSEDRGSIPRRTARRAKKLAQVLFGHYEYLQMFIMPTPFLSN